MIRLQDILTEADPKKGTGKKPKGSGRRLYTDENPKDTVSVKFKTRQDVVDTLTKKSFKSKSHKRQSQIINLIHQRLRVAVGRTKDPVKKKRLKSAFEYIKKRKEASKRKTQRMRKSESIAPNHDGKAAPYGSGYNPVAENFADGKKPGRKGLSKRVGVSQKMSIAKLAKIAKTATGERKRMAQWNLNMKRGRKKK